MNNFRSYVWDRVVDHLHAQAPVFLEAGNEFIEGLTLLILCIVEQAVEQAVAERARHDALLLDLVVENAVESTITRQNERLKVASSN